MAKYMKKMDQDLRGLCDEGSNSLSPLEKKRVEEWKEGKKGYVKIKGRKDVHGNGLEEILKRDIEKMKEEREKIEDVDKMLAEGIARKHFFLLHTNIYARIEESDWYVPAEISMVKFSVREGVVNVIQAFPEAGPIPLGYRRVCMESSAMGHMIPLADEQKDEENVHVKSDYQIMEDIETLLDGTDTVFCMAEMIDQCKGVMRTISTRRSLKNPVKKFLDLPELFYKLVNSSPLGMVVPSRGILETELNRER